MGIIVIKYKTRLFEQELNLLTTNVIISCLYLLYNDII